MLIISNTVTNTLATITNGTNIYLQQQITTTHISNITETLTNTINNIPQLDKVWYQDPTMWAAIATVVSAIIMACTFLKIKQQEKDTQYREDKKELRERIEKYILPEYEKLKEIRTGKDKIIPIEDIENFNLYSYQSLVNLQLYSIGLFYQDKIIKICNKIKVYYPIIESPKEYSDPARRLFSILLHNISMALYRALIDEQVFEGLMRSIDPQTKELERNLTPIEIKRLQKFHLERNNK